MHVISIFRKSFEIKGSFLWCFQEEKAKVIQTLLFVAGLNTLLQALFGTRLPAVIGGSYTFVMPTISIILAGRYSDIVDPREVYFDHNRSLFITHLVMFPVKWL